MLTHYRSTYHGADLWWIHGYPEDEGSFIVVVEPDPDGQMVPTRIDELTIKLFSEIENRIPPGLILKANRVEYKRVPQAFSVVEPKATLMVPETIAFMIAALLFGAWISFVRYRPETKVTAEIYAYAFNILIGALGSALSAFLVALCAWLVRRRQAKHGRKVVYEDDRYLRS